METSSTPLRAVRPRLRITTLESHWKGGDMEFDHSFTILYTYIATVLRKNWETEQATIFFADPTQPIATFLTRDVWSNGDAHVLDRYHMVKCILSCSVSFFSCSQTTLFLTILFYDIGLPNEAVEMVYMHYCNLIQAILTLSQFDRFKPLKLRKLNWFQLKPG